MKELNKQVTSLELSKQLKEAGYLQEGVWWWIYDPELQRKHYPQINYSEKDRYTLSLKRIDSYRSFVAPTVAELGEALPIGYKTYKTYNNEWIATDEKNLLCIIVDTEANARAKCWLYLKKEKLI